MKLDVVFHICSDRCVRYEQRVRTARFAGSKACYCSLAFAARVCWLVFNFCNAAPQTVVLLQRLHVLLHMNLVNCPSRLRGAGKVNVTPVSLA